MTETQWEKTTAAAPQASLLARLGRWKFIIVGVAILAVAGYLLVTGTGVGARYYVTVDSLVNDPDMLNKTVRVAGAVAGDPTYNPDTQELRFYVANIPNDNDTIKKQGGLAAVLHQAVEDPNATRMLVIAKGKEIPDLLQNEAQAIMSGKLKEVDGQYVFYADEITLKCPTRYADQVPQQVSE